MPRFHRFVLFAALVLICTLIVLSYSDSSARSSGLRFRETGYTVREPFLTVWKQGGIERFGLPISGELSETSRDDGQIYTVQYFERARLELHPASSQPVKLGRLGAELAPPASAGPAAPACTRFPETGHALCGPMETFWTNNGGLDLFGFPIGPVQALMGTDGVTREVQYTERARIELNPATGQITLGLLGRERLAATPPPPPEPWRVPAEALRVVELANAERAAVGLAPLALSEELTSAAQEHSDAMASNGLISHTGADGRGPAQRISDAGYRWLRCGENIAVGQRTPEEAMAFWMGSPPHRANILDPGMREIGVGYVWQPGGYGYYWTMTLGQP